jgi:hypothetical protein
MVEGVAQSRSRTGRTCPGGLSTMVRSAAWRSIRRKNEFQDAAQFVRHRHILADGNPDQRLFQRTASVSITAPTISSLEAK